MWKAQQRSGLQSLWRQHVPPASPLVALPLHWPHTHSWSSQHSSSLVQGWGGGRTELVCFNVTVCVLGFSSELLKRSLWRERELPSDFEARRPSAWTSFAKDTLRLHLQTHCNAVRVELLPGSDGEKWRTHTHRPALTTSDKKIRSGTFTYHIHWFARLTPGVACTLKAILSLSTVLSTHTLGRHDRRHDKRQRVVFTFQKTNLFNAVLQVTEVVFIWGGAVCLLCKGGAPVKFWTFQEVYCCFVCLQTHLFYQSGFRLSFILKTRWWRSQGVVLDAQRWARTHFSQRAPGTHRFQLLLLLHVTITSASST